MSALRPKISYRRWSGSGSRRTAVRGLARALRFLPRSLRGGLASGGVVQRVLVGLRHRDVSILQLAIQCAGHTELYQAARVQHANVCLNLCHNVCLHLDRTAGVRRPAGARWPRALGRHLRGLPPLLRLRGAGGGRRVLGGRRRQAHGQGVAGPAAGLDGRHLGLSSGVAPERCQLRRVRLAERGEHPVGRDRPRAGRVLDDLVPASPQLLVGRVGHAVGTRVPDDQEQGLLALVDVLRLEVALALPSKQHVRQELAARDDAEHPSLEDHRENQRPQHLLEAPRPAPAPLARDDAVDEAGEHEGHVRGVHTLLHLAGLPEGLLPDVREHLGDVLGGGLQGEARRAPHGLAGLVRLDLLLRERRAHELARERVERLYLVRVPQGHLVQRHREEQGPALDRAAHVLRRGGRVEVGANLPEGGRVPVHRPQEICDLLRGRLVAMRKVRDVVAVREHGRHREGPAVGLGVVREPVRALQLRRGRDRQ
mmetsp:Transcript_91463/g.259023  ORF Transcript_91463/g.259023 Transcript_91463/m.259023 type:complete len:483 (+) Transcript_91463:210-1658(+)